MTSRVGEPLNTLDWLMSRIRINLNRTKNSSLWGVGAAIGIWELLPLLNVLPAKYFPPPNKVIPKSLNIIAQGSFWDAMVSTALACLIGVSAACVVGVILGIVIGSNSVIYRLTNFIVEFLRPIPAVGLIPLGILMFGITSTMKVALIFYATLWPIMIQSIYGVQDLDPVSRDTAKSFGFNRRDIFCRLILPSAGPFVATGLRLATALAIVISVTVELISGQNGLGSLMLVAQSNGSMVALYALILITGIFSYAVSAILARTEKAVLHWHLSFRSDQL